MIEEGNKNGRNGGGELGGGRVTILLGRRGRGNEERERRERL